LHFFSIATTSSASGGHDHYAIDDNPCYDRVDHPAHNYTNDDRGNHRDADRDADHHSEFFDGRYCFRSDRSSLYR
jgi:hypothetical protein